MEAVTPEPADVPEAGGAGDDRAATPEDEMKRKFREALERKRQAQGRGAGGRGRDGAKVHHAHGPAGGRREFRRKSG